MNVLPPISLDHAQRGSASLRSPGHDDLLLFPEAQRSRLFLTANPRQQKEYGQFLTPPHVADLMAGMFTQTKGSTIRLLDAGAGLGMLSAAFVRRQLLGKTLPERIEITAYELDPALIDGITKTYEACRAACAQCGIEFQATIRNADFITEGVELLRGDLFSGVPERYDAAIVNPPYGKLSTSSAGYRLLQAVHSETTNFYSAFLNLIIGLLKSRGELVAITPRSFCNGPYFKPFRQRLLSEMSLQRIHVFESRSAAFKHDRVLQENIILHAVKNAPPPPTIQISQSAGGENEAVHTRLFSTMDIVSPDDSESFIHIPTAASDRSARRRMEELSATLSSLGLAVSTGRVVDFRTRDNIRQRPEADTCPLIYPCHFDGPYVAWPKEHSRKPNAIKINEQTDGLLVPSGSGLYVLTKRFTSKEERRRVVACIYDPSRVTAEYVGFENHLNYFHQNGQGLEITLAKGLWAFLNSSALDLYFRQFNGHTQVNATDLRNMRFPSMDQLRQLGTWADNCSLTQAEIDHMLKENIGPYPDTMAK